VPLRPPAPPASPTPGPTAGPRAGGAVPARPRRGATVATAVWGWDEAVQRGFHERWFDPGQVQIITADGLDVGVLAVEYRPAEIRLARIEIHPDHQGRGIGSRLIRGLLDEARGQDRPVVLDVLVVNRRAHALYRRLGFRDLFRHGEGNRKIRMRSRSSRATDSASYGR
jgi:GNAT superfamily N-acetyltransferase